MENLAKLIQISMNRLDMLNSEYTTILLATTQINTEEVYSAEIVVPELEQKIICDRMVISVGIKVPGYKKYDLDARCQVVANIKQFHNTIGSLHK